jgi:hypothetical protein
MSEAEPRRPEALSAESIALSRAQVGRALYNPFGKEVGAVG